VTAPDAEKPTQPDPGRPHRLLVVAAEEVHGSQVREAVAEHAQGRSTEVRLIAPALIVSAIENAMGDVDDAMVAARERADHSVEELKRAGIDAESAIGDADLRLAIQDALQTFDADEILIVAHRDGGPYLERRGIEEAERDFEPPITELFVERHDGSEPTVAQVEHKPAGQRDRDPGEVEGSSGNMPPYSPLDLIGIIVAIIGTGVLVVLAAAGGENLNADGGFNTASDGGFTNQSARILIAGAAGLINLAHVVGLTLFQAGPYRGFGRKLFTWISLIGTPVAILVSLILLD
jgi:hypothetical protein